VPPLAPFLLAIAAVAAAIDWIAVWLDGPRARAVERVAKPAVMLALLGVVIAWPATTGDVAAARPWLIAALAASLAGDVLLLPPGRFVAGLVAFLLAHLAYLVAFAQLPGSLPWLVVGLVLAALLVATVGRALVAAAQRLGLAIPVAVYLAAICAMAVAATRTGLPAAIVGAWLFVASDALLGWGRFRAPDAASPRGSAALRLAVIVTYHLGQLLLVLALLGRPA
jgi:uncharacterized membrane protein YhhN